MDRNKDAARQCFAIGKNALHAGNTEKALRFLAKAQQLDPSLLLSSTLSKLREDLNDSTSQNCHYQTEIKQSASETVTANVYSASNVVASAEQVEIVQRISKTKDYYEILGLTKDCTAEEIRKAYRKISLKVHPDKNSAPGAEDAFKHVSKAFACLNNDSARLSYDQYGPEDSHRLGHHGNAHHRHGYRGYAYDDIFDADDIFSSFFGSTSAFHRAQYVRKYKRTASTRQAQTNGRSESSEGLLTTLQILLALALLLISLLPFSKPIYSMEKVAPYEFQHSTKEHQVPFYVKSTEFNREYPPGSFSRRSLEAKVEREMIEILGYNCRRELNFRRWNPSLQTPNCDRLKVFFNR